MFRRALQDWHRRPTKPHRRSAHTQSRNNPRFRRLLIEPLEDRHLLTTITVTTLSDIVNPNDGLTTLREAIAQAASGDMIDFSVTGQIQLAPNRGELLIDKSLQINGPGAGMLTIKGFNMLTLNGTGSRVFNIDDADDNNLIDVEIGGLTLTACGVAGDGGAIRSTENLALSQVTIDANTAWGNGGGIWQDQANLTIKDSTISQNRASFSYGGGGIASRNSTVTIIRSIIVSNNAFEGALRYGGGIYADHGTLDVISSTIASNIAGTQGGGISTFVTHLTITDSTIMSNFALSPSGEGGGVYVWESYPDIAMISGSTISGNGGQNGGGIYLASGSLNIENSTISGNRATQDGGGVLNRTFVGALLVRHSTITANRVNRDSSRGSGIFAAGGQSPYLDHSIVAGNTVVAPSTPQYPGDVVGTFSAAYTIIGNIGQPGGQATIFDFGGNQIGTNVSPIDPLVGPLADNGGPTMTHALLAGSPAINAGDPAAMAGVNGVPMNDQRSAPYTRVYGGRIDIGAFESQPTDYVLGDFNRDGRVDAADYVVYRRAAGSAVQPGTGADGNGDGVVNQLDFALWKGSFGIAYEPPAAGSQPASALQAAKVAEPDDARTMDARSNRSATPIIFSRPRTLSARVRVKPSARQVESADQALAAWVASRLSGRMARQELAGVSFGRDHAAGGAIQAGGKLAALDVAFRSLSAAD